MPVFFNVFRPPVILARSSAGAFCNFVECVVGETGSGGGAGGGGGAATGGGGGGERAATGGGGVRAGEAKAAAAAGSCGRDTPELESITLDVET